MQMQRNKKRERPFLPHVAALESSIHKGLMWLVCVGAAALSIAACGQLQEPTEPDCIQVFTYGTTDPAPATRLKVLNKNGTGLSVRVQPEGGLPATQSGVFPGGCAEWGFGGDAVGVKMSVEVQQCSQDEAYNPTCTRFHGTKVYRNRTALAGQTVYFEVFHFWQ